MLAGAMARGDDDGQIATFKARAGYMAAAAISTDGQRLLTGEDDGLVTLWDVNTTGTTPLVKFAGHFPRRVLACALLADGKHGLSSGDDDMVDVWNLESGKLVQQMSTGNSIPVVLSCSPDSPLTAAGCDDGRVYIWEALSGHKVTLLTRKAAVCGLSFSPDGRILAAGYLDGVVVLWDTKDWNAKVTLPDDHLASVGALAFSPDSKLLATGNQNGAGYIWDTANGSQRVSFAGYANPDVPPRPPVAPVFPGSRITPTGRAAIMYLAFSRNASMLLGSVQDNMPRFWRASDGQSIGTADWFADNRFYVARFGFTYATASITPDRKYIALLKENTAQVWHCPWKPNPPPQ